MTSERRLRKTATSQERPQLPKRSTSVRRVWRSLFGQQPPTPEHSPTRASGSEIKDTAGPLSPTSQTAPSPVQNENGPQSPHSPVATPPLKQSIDDAQPRPSVQSTRSHGSAALDAREEEQRPEEAPGKAPASELELLRQELDQARYDLGEARAIVYSQEDELAYLQRGEEKLRGEYEAEYKEKEAALARHKTAIEERMVTVVVQQISEAKKLERKNAKAEYEKTYRNEVVSLSSLNCHANSGIAQH